MSDTRLNGSGDYQTRFVNKQVMIIEHKNF